MFVSLQLPTLFVRLSPVERVVNPDGRFVIVLTRLTPAITRLLMFAKIAFGHGVELILCRAWLAHPMHSLTATNIANASSTQTQICHSGRVSIQSIARSKSFICIPSTT
jgi:hypothetical protein